MAQDRSLPPLTALQAFLVAGRNGSFEAAARTLGVTPSAISHQIRALERWLGKPLFLRHIRRVELTRDGRAFLKVLDHSFARIRTAADRLRAADGAGGTLRISALPLFTSAWLIPRLEAFERAHPDVLLDIDSTNRIVDFDSEPVDLAIRNTASPTPGLEHRKLLDVRPVPMCSATLRQQLCQPADLACHTLIHVSARPGSWARWLAAVGCAGLRPRRELTFDSVTAAMEAAAHDRGIILGMDPIAWDAPIADKLVRALPERVDGTASYYLVCRKADLARPKVRSFIDWLTGEMAVYRRRRRERDAARP
jgi:LysR family glycine cleavage system transcriptional activator